MKKLLSIIIIALFTINISVAQESDTSEVYRIVQVMPEYPGGNEEMHKFIEKNVNYPQQALDSNITGTIYISFVIEKDGSIARIQMTKGTSDIGGGCLEEGIRIVKSMPKWTPGKQRGDAVRVSYVLPIEFTLSKKAQKRNEKRKKKN